MSMLELTDIRKEYQKGQRTVEALAGVSLSIEKGEFLSIVGPSGSGKTTLLNILGCLDSPSSGSVRYNGVELHAMTENTLAGYRRDNIAFIFQSYNLIPVLTVRENVELPLEIEKKYSKKEMAEKALKVIGGQEQRVAIARALVKTPLVVLADEPTANLDSHTAEDIISIMQKMNADLKTTFIFSTHDPLMQKHARRKIILKDGRIAQDERR
jgi:putative ABC transport system ATP-binding protein